ncbi:MAG: hypothetical protein ABWY20_23090 [Mycobacterium sp.]
MAKKAQPGQRVAERPEFPKPLVRLKSDAGGYSSEVQMVGDSDAERAAKDAGWGTLDVPATPADFQEYPKWVYHEDGRRQIVQSQTEADTLDGYTDIPVSDPAVPATKEVPPPVAAALVSHKHRPPVPADRG